MRALIVGGGIGGFTAAIALQRGGVSTAIFERAPDLRAIQRGGGLSLYSNAMRQMARLGLQGSLETVGSRIEWHEFRNSRGDMLIQWPLGELSRRIGAPILSFRRQDLHQVLAGALERGVLKLGTTCTGFVQDGAGVVARFADGREEHGDLLVGADGRDSTIRPLLVPGSSPRYTGTTIWQGEAEVDPEQAPVGIFTRLMGPGSSFAYFRVAAGRRLVWIAFANAPQGGHDVGDVKRKLLDRFRGWRPPVEQIIEATAEAGIFRMDLYGGRPLGHWSHGRVTLLGDAAHTMTPNLGQGAGLAIEDAIALAKCLKDGEDVQTALRRYERLRIKRTSSLMTLAWRIGAMARWKGPIACGARDRLLKLASGFMLKEEERIMAYDV